MIIHYAEKSFPLFELWAKKNMMSDLPRQLFQAKKKVKELSKWEKLGWLIHWLSTPLFFSAFIMACWFSVEWFTAENPANRLSVWMFSIPAGTLLLAVFSRPNSKVEEGEKLEEKARPFVKLTWKFTSITSIGRETIVLLDESELRECVDSALTKLAMAVKEKEAQGKKAKEEKERFKSAYEDMYRLGLTKKGWGPYFGDTKTSTA